MPSVPPPRTPDGRYFVVRGRLWRSSNPALPADERERGHRVRVHAAKLALGERGPPWWGDGAPDYNRRMARNTLYRAWFEAL